MPRRAARRARRRGGADRRHARRDRETARGVPRQDEAARRLLPSARQPGRHPRRPSDRRGLLRDPGDPANGGDPLVIIRKSAQEIERMARAGRVVAETHGAARRPRPAGRHDRRARRARRGVHPLAAAASRPSWATRASRPRSASRRTTWSSTASPAPTGWTRATSSRSTSASRSTASSPTPPTRMPSARSPPRRRACSRWDSRRWRPQSRRRGRGTTCPTSAHAVQSVTEAAGYSVIRSLVGHGVGRSMHEDPQIPNFGAPGPRAACCSPG